MAKKKTTKKTTSKNNLSSKRKRIATKKLATSKKKKSTSKTKPKKNTAPKTTTTKKIEPKIVIEEIKEEPKKEYKIKRKLILSRAFLLVFMIMFVVSLCTSMYVLADTLPFNVENAEISDKSENTTGTITSFSNDEIINNITFHKVNDYVVYKLNIKSNLPKEVTILSITDDNNNSYLEYQYDKKENKKVVAKSSFELLVRVTYKNELTNISKRDQTNNVKLTIKYLEDNEEKEGTIIINPKTGDNIHVSYILLLISSIGLIVCIVVDKKRKNKKLSKLSLFIITGLLISPLAVKAATIAVNIEFKTEIGLYNKLIVTYVVDEEEKTLTTDYNTIVTGLETPEKDGYTFTKWTYEDGSDFNPNEAIKEDIKIIANFKSDKHTITYELHGGVTSSANPVEFTKNTETFTLINPTKTGYKFKGWSGTDLVGDENKTVTIEKGTDKDLSYEANYTANNYQVKFEKNGVNVTGTMDNQTFTYDLEAALNAVGYTKEGYTFTGWNTAAEGEGTHYEDEGLVKNLTSTKDEIVSLYAEWEKNSYTIKFNSNAPTGTTAEGTMNDLNMLYDTPKTLPLNMYTINGYTFDSWNTSPDGLGDKINNGAEVNNLVTSGEITLYAKWNINEHTVTFNTDGGTEIASQTVTHNNYVTRPETDPKKMVHAFDDWYTTSEYTTKFDFTKPITKNTTIYARYTELPFETVFSHTAECTFNGSSGFITGNNCSYANGENKFINTGINLYDETNHDKDYEIGFTIVEYDPSNNINQATFMNTKLEGNNYPGLVFRRKNSTKELDLSSRKEEKNNAAFYTNYVGIKQVKIYRIYNEIDDVQEIFYSINNQPKVKLNDLSEFNPVFTQSVWFGAAPKDTTAKEAQRHLIGTLSNMYIKVGKYVE